MSFPHLCVDTDAKVRTKVEHPNIRCSLRPVWQRGLIVRHRPLLLPRDESVSPVNALSDYPNVALCSDLNFFPNREAQQLGLLFKNK